MQFTRRSFLLYTGPLALFPVLPKECSSWVDRYVNQSSPFIHGVASGDPLQDRVVLWTRVTGDAGAPRKVPVSWTIASDPELKRVVASGVTLTTEDVDFTVKIDADRLKAGTTYYYRFRALGYDSPVGRTRTLPRQEVQRLRLALASCSNHPYGYFNAYAAIARRQDLDAVLHLGDYIYEYPNGEFGDGTALGRLPNPPHELLSLRDYRTRHAQYKTDPDLQAAHRQHPFIAIWDDHEVANNAWRDGAENHQPDEGDFGSRKAAAIQAYFEWMPLRAEEQDQSGQIYRSFGFGKLADLILLDTRLVGRDQQVADACDATTIADPNRQLLGEEQEQWLFEQLEASQQRDTRWRLLGQQVMFGQLLNMLTPGRCPLNVDQWDGYAVARSRVLGEIQGQEINNVVVLTGDIHSSWGMDIAPNPFDPRAYDPLTGRGSVAVEFVAPAVTSPGIEDPVAAQQLAAAVRLTHPHIKFVELYRRGYALLDITSECVQCEWYHVATLQERTPDESFAAALFVASGQNHLQLALAPTTPRGDAPPFAPAAASSSAVV